MNLFLRLFNSAGFFCLRMTRFLFRLSLGPKELRFVEILKLSFMVPEI